MIPEETIIARNKIYNALTKAVGAVEPDGNSATSSSERTEKRNLNDMITRYLNTEVNYEW